jgi:hypothetical protein
MARYWKQPDGCIIFTNVPEKLQKPYEIYMQLPLEEKAQLSAIMSIFMDKLSNFGQNAALELVFKLGLYLAGGNKHE